MGNLILQNMFLKEVTIHLYTQYTLLFNFTIKSEDSVVHQSL